MRAFFPMPRYGHVTSNIAEETNASLAKIRKYPPTKLFIKAIQKINATFTEKREKYPNGNETGLVDTTFAKVVKNTEKGRRLEARRVSENVFDVDSHAGSEVSRVVNLHERTCSCIKFQDLGIPCEHACSAALKDGVDILSLCIDERHIGTLRMVYQFGIIPIDIETIPSLPLEAPLARQQPGRPKVKRIRRQNEDRPKRVFFCSLCGKPGHNKKTCPNTVPNRVFHVVWFSLVSSCSCQDFFEPDRMVFCIATKHHLVTSFDNSPSRGSFESRVSRTVFRNELRFVVFDVF